MIIFLFLLITEICPSQLYNATLLQIAKNVWLPHDADIFYITTSSPKVTLKGVKTDVLQTISSPHLYAAIIDPDRFIRAIHLRKEIRVIDSTATGQARFPKMTASQKVAFNITFACKIQ